MRQQLLEETVEGGMRGLGMSVHAAEAAGGNNTLERFLGGRADATNMARLMHCLCLRGLQLWFRSNNIVHMHACPTPYKHRCTYPPAPSHTHTRTHSTPGQQQRYQDIHLPVDGSSWQARHIPPPYPLLPTRNPLPPTPGRNHHHRHLALSLQAAGARCTWPQTNVRANNVARYLHPAHRYCMPTTVIAHVHRELSPSCFHLATCQVARCTATAARPIRSRAGHGVHECCTVPAADVAGSIGTCSKKATPYMPALGVRHPRCSKHTQASCAQ